MAWYRMRDALCCNNVLKLEYKEIADFVRKIKERSEVEEEDS